MDDESNNAAQRSVGSKRWVLQERREALGRVVCTLELGEQHRNIQGVVHGSVTMALLDDGDGARARLAPRAPSVLLDHAGLASSF